MQILITGGAGFVGANLALHLAQEGHTVQVLDNLVRRGSELNLPRLRDAGVTFRHGDIRCPEDWDGLEADVVLECAAQPSAIDGYLNPKFDFTNNTVGVLHTLEFCRQHNAGIIFWSTNKVYPVSEVNRLANPSLNAGEDAYTGHAIDEYCPLDGGDRSLYGASKIMADLMIQEWADSFGIPAVINRCSCLYGPWQWGKSEQGWVSWWVIAHRLELPLTYIGFDGKQVRDCLHIDDLARLISLELKQLKPGATVVNVGGGDRNAISLRECTRHTQAITGCQVPLLVEEHPRRADFAHYVSCIARVEAIYGWSPQIGIEDGLRSVDDWAMYNLPEIQQLYGQMAPRSMPQRDIIGL
jgi:CDP-paratose 2-epimerase